jgi:hypothetical protein
MWSYLKQGACVKKFPMTMGGKFLPTDNQLFSFLAAKTACSFIHTCKYSQQKLQNPSSSGLLDV